MTRPWLFCLLSLVTLSLVSCQCGDQSSCASCVTSSSGSSSCHWCLPHKACVPSGYTTPSSCPFYHARPANSSLACIGEPTAVPAARWALSSALLVGGLVSCVLGLRFERAMGAVLGAGLGAGIFLAASFYTKGAPWLDAAGAAGAGLGLALAFSMMRLPRAAAFGGVGVVCVSVFALVIPPVHPPLVVAAPVLSVGLVGGCALGLLLDDHAIIVGSSLAGSYAAMRGLDVALGGPVGIEAALGQALARAEVKDKALFPMVAGFVLLAAGAAFLQYQVVANAKFRRLRRRRITRRARTEAGMGPLLEEEEEQGRRKKAGKGKGQGQGQGQGGGDSDSLASSEKDEVLRAQRGRRNTARNTVESFAGVRVDKEDKPAPASDKVVRPGSDVLLDVVPPGEWPADLKGSLHVKVSERIDWINGHVTTALRENRLALYKSQREVFKPPDHTLRLDKIQDARQVEVSDKAGPKCVAKITTPKHTWLIGCDSQKELSDWIAKLHVVINFARVRLSKGTALPPP